MMNSDGRFQTHLHSHSDLNTIAITMILNSFTVSLISILLWCLWSQHLHADSDLKTITVILISTPSQWLWSQNDHSDSDLNSFTVPLISTSSQWHWFLCFINWFVWFCISESETLSPSRPYCLWEPLQTTKIAGAWPRCTTPCSLGATPPAVKLCCITEGNWEWGMRMAGMRLTR